MGGIVLALSSPTWAVGIPLNQAYNGPLYMQITNWDMGTYYTGHLAGGTTDVTTGVWYAPSALDSYRSTSLQTGEDSWGIFRVTSIFNATLDTITNSVSQGSTQLYVYGTGSTEIVGMFRGRADNQVMFDLVGGKLQQTIRSSGDTIDMYTQPLGTATNWDAGMFGPAGRTAADAYKLIGHDAAGANLPAAELVLQGVNQTGFLDDGVMTTFTPSPSGMSGNGGFGMYVSWTGGTELLKYDTNIFKNGAVTADVQMAGSIWATSLPFVPLPGYIEPWLARTSDPVGLGVVPEPVTMASVLLGIGCLSRYIRKRR
jgi:hypothetical protein